MLIEFIQDRSTEYNEYLTNHINNVKRAYNEILRPYLLKDPIYQRKVPHIDIYINKHDESKYSEIEYDAYLNHFYPADDGEPTTQEEYDMAWLHHQKTNPHHWQYWVLIKDTSDKKYVPLRMDFVSICEMLCDWSSFHYVEGKEDSTANQWYKDHHNEMILHPDTIETVEMILKNCPEL